MKIFNVSQIREIDAYTIENEPISSIDLMERAAEKATKWILNRFPGKLWKYFIFCGPGNNGGDGLAIARLLSENALAIDVFCLGISSRTTKDFDYNLERLKLKPEVKIHHISEGATLPDPDQDAIIIDAIFGSGLSRPILGYWSDLIEHLNSCISTIIAIDIPSGTFADKPTLSTSIRADYTLTFQQPKLAFMFPENLDKVGRWFVLDIGLHRDIINSLTAKSHLVTQKMVKSVFKKRRRFDHKGTFGHALLICGGYGKVGAALLAARACLRVGVGKLTVHIPKYAYSVIQTGIPEAMVEIDEHEYWFSSKKGTDTFEALGIGCGLGQKSVTAEGLHQILRNSTRPMVLDADAINILAEHNDWLDLLHPGTIITPHPGEYRRLFGDSINSFERLDQQITHSMKHHIYIVLKGAYTCITTPEGKIYFNPTGNPGMATAGSGDVLTGIITGLLAQGHTPEESCLAGVYCHGLAGDLGVEKIGEYSLIASDIIDQLGAAICKIQS